MKSDVDAERGWKKKSRNYKGKQIKREKKRAESEGTASPIVPATSFYTGYFEDEGQTRETRINV